MAGLLSGARPQWRRASLQLMAFSYHNTELPQRKKLPRSWARQVVWRTRAGLGHQSRPLSWAVAVSVRGLVSARARPARLWRRTSPPNPYWPVNLCCCGRLKRPTRRVCLPSTTRQSDSRGAIETLDTRSATWKSGTPRGPNTTTASTGLIRLGFVMLGNHGTAEDVVQDAFLGLYRNWDGVHPGARGPRRRHWTRH